MEYLDKAYGTTVAVDDVSFSVRRGEIFGSSGAMAPARRQPWSASRAGGPDGGQARVPGLDPCQDQEELHERLGVQLPQGALPPKLKVGEAVELHASSFFERPVDAAVLLQRLRSGAMRGSYWRALPGGQEQRLSIVPALIGQPEAAVLDELTTGLDPGPRRETWGLIDSVRDSGVTIVLVTRFMEEAGRLCDRVALIDQGRVVALGEPSPSASLRPRRAFALGEPSHLAEQAATATRVRLRAPGQWMLQRGGRRRTSSNSSPSGSISASTP